MQWSCTIKLFYLTDGEKQSTDISLGQLSNDSKRPSLQMSPSSSNNEAPLNQVSELPALCDLDMGVLESLPPELLSEINDMYAGKLSDFIRKRKGKNENVSGTMCTTSYEIYEGNIILFSYATTDSALYIQKDKNLTPC